MGIEKHKDALIERARSSCDGKLDDDEAMALIGALDEAEARAEAAEAALRAVEATCAVMREALDECRDDIADIARESCVDGDEVHDAQNARLARVDAALATNAGAGLIAEVERLRRVRDAACAVSAHYWGAPMLADAVRHGDERLGGHEALRAALADVEGGGA